MISIEKHRFHAFIKGAARIIDMGATFDIYSENNSGSMADSIAIRKDWETVGKDIYDAISIFKEQNSHV